MKYFIALTLSFLPGCAWLQSHPDVEKELESVGEELVKDGLQVAEGAIAK
jgi:hypothetical protein